MHLGANLSRASDSKHIKTNCPWPCQLLRRTPEPDQPMAGWQQKASRELEERFIRDDGWPGFDNSSSEISTRASGVSTLHRTPHVKSDQDGRPAVSTPLAQTLVLAPPFLSSANLTSLATIVQCVCGGRGSAQKGSSSGVCSRTGLPRGRRTGCHQRAREGHGFGSLQCSGRPQAGSCGSWFDPVAHGAQLAIDTTPFFFFFFETR